MRRRPEDLRSHRWFGVDDLRAFGHRSRTKQMGYASEDYAGKPVIAILNTWSDLNPCHAHFRQRADDVKRGVWQAGGFPVEVPAVSLGETFMKPTTMLYRNLLAMETEELLRSNPVDGVVMLGGCDKTVPAMLMGATSMNLPAIFVPAGPMLRGHWRGQTLGSGSDVWKYWAEKRAGAIDDCTWRELEDGIARSYGTCMTMGTASTMAAAAEALGMTMPGASSIPAADSAHPRMAAAAGRRIVELVWDDVTPKKIMTADAFDNAVTVTMAIGGSTNAVIHLIAMARRAGVALDLDWFDALSRRTPVIGDIRPSGRFLMEDFYYAGGLRGLMARLRDLLHLECATVSGQTLGHGLDEAVISNDEVIRVRSNPASVEGGVAVLRGNLAPRGAGDQADGRDPIAAGSHGAGRGVSRLQRPVGAHRPSRPSGDGRLGDRAAARGSAWWAGDARVGHAPDSEEAVAGRCSRHGPHLGCADERDRVRHLRAPRGAGIVCRRTAGFRVRRRSDRAQRPRAPAHAERERA